MLNIERRILNVEAKDRPKRGRFYLFILSVVPKLAAFSVIYTDLSPTFIVIITLSH